MGYETDTYTLMSNQALTSVVSPGTFAFSTTAVSPGYNAAGGNAFYGTDFVEGVLRVKFTAITTAPTSLYLLLQSLDATGNTATDWYPNAAAVALAAFVTALGAAPNNGTPRVLVGGQVILTAAPATTDRYLVPIVGSPGQIFRLGVLAIGAAGAFNLTVQGDFRKWVADST